VFCLTLSINGMPQLGGGLKLIMGEGGVSARFTDASLRVEARNDSFCVREATSDQGKSLSLLRTEGKRGGRE